MGCPAAFPYRARSISVCQVLDAHAHRERLRLKVHAVSVQRGKVSRASDRWPAPPARRRCPAVRLNGAERTVFDRNAGQRRAEAHFTAVFDDLAAHFTNYILEDIRADVRLRLFDDIRRSTVRGKDFQHVVAQRITDARGQLAVQ